MQKVVIDEARCKGCALCSVVCPRALIRMAETINRQGLLPAVVSPENQQHCISCAQCAHMCPDVAISVFRQGSST